MDMNYPQRPNNRRTSSPRRRSNSSDEDKPPNPQYMGSRTTQGSRWSSRPSGLQYSDHRSRKTPASDKIEDDYEEPVVGYALSQLGRSDSSITRTIEGRGTRSPSSVSTSFRSASSGGVSYGDIVSSYDQRSSPSSNYEPSPLIATAQDALAGSGGGEPKRCFDDGRRDPDLTITDHNVHTQSWIDQLDDAYTDAPVDDLPSISVHPPTILDRSSRRSISKPRPPRLEISSNSSVQKQHGLLDSASRGIAGTSGTATSSAWVSTASLAKSEDGSSSRLSAAGFSDHDDPFGIGLSSIANCTNSVVGSYCESNLGSFSRVGRGRSKNHDVQSESGLLPSARRSPSSEYFDSKAQFEEFEDMKVKVEREKFANAELSKALTEKDEEIKRLKDSIVEKENAAKALESESKSMMTLQQHRHERNLKETLQAFGVIRPNNVKPVWKADTDGSRRGPLYNDIPNIYRESAVEALLSRAALRKMLEDYGTMVTVAYQALLGAQTLKFEPLTARCHFVYGVALFYTCRFREALGEFELSYGNHSQYGISDDLIQEWADGCMQAMGSTSLFSYEAASLVTPTTGANDNHLSVAATARKIWGSPAEAQATIAQILFPGAGRRRASTILQAEVSPASRPGANATAAGDNYSPAMAVANNYNGPRSAGQNYNPRSAVRYRDAVDGPGSARFAPFTSRCSDPWTSRHARHNNTFTTSSSHYQRTSGEGSRLIAGIANANSIRRATATGTTTSVAAASTNNNPDLTEYLQFSKANRFNTGQ